MVNRDLYCVSLDLDEDTYVEKMETYAKKYIESVYFRLTDGQNTFFGQRDNRQIKNTWEFADKKLIAMGGELHDSQILSLTATAYDMTCGDSAMQSWQDLRKNIMIQDEPEMSTGSQVALVTGIFVAIAIVLGAGIIFCIFKYE